MRQQRRQKRQHDQPGVGSPPGPPAVHHSHPSDTRTSHAGLRHSKEPLTLQRGATGPSCHRRRLCGAAEGSAGAGRRSRPSWAEGEARVRALGIETARAAGASWADLAHPLGVASRQAAERRYLRGRPGPTGTTGEQRVQATRERRAAERPLTAWARNNAADLRRIAGQITALTELPPAARSCVSQLDAARPLNATRPYLTHLHPDLAARLDALTDTTSAASD
ncbi:hypothetical protein ACWEWX_17245 [Streptomyces asiaticus]